MTLDADASLAEVYRRAFAAYAACIAQEDRGSLDPDHVKSTLSHISEARALVERADILSRNETLEDVADADLPLLLLPAMHAKVAALSSAAQPSSARLETARASAAMYRDFLYGLELLEALPPAEQDYLRAVERGPSAVSRDAKIQRFRRAQEVQQLAERLLRPGHDVNGEVPREYRVQQLVLFAQQALDELDMLAAEVQILESRPPPAQHAQASGSAATPAAEAEAARDNTWRVDMPKPLLDRSGKVMRSFVIHADAQKVRDRVFKPGHNLPTMTVDEYLANERARGNMLSGGTEADVAQKALAAEAEEDVYESDAAWRKKQAWDDWKDENPKGEGNRGSNRG